MTPPEATAMICAEGVRPIFARWGNSAVVAVYDDVLDALWTEVRTRGEMDGLLAKIEELPESRLDDSHRRDFFVMIALGVVHHAVEVLQAPEDEKRLRDLESLFGHLMRELESLSALRELEGACSDVTTSTRPVQERVRAAAARVAALIDASLGPAAMVRGWPPDRTR